MTNTIYLSNIQIPKLTGKEEFDYPLLLSDKITRDTALRILKKVPENPSNRQWAIENAAKLAVRFKIEKFPSWMGYSKDTLKSLSIYNSFELLLDKLENNSSNEVLKMIQSPDQVDRNGETLFHKVCKWNHYDKFNLLKYLIKHAFDYCREDYQGNHPFDLVESHEIADFIDLLIHIDCPETPEEYREKPIQDTAWMDILIKLKNLKIALSYADRKPHSLVHIMCTNLSMIKQEGQFPNGVFRSCLQHLFEKKVQFKQIVPFLNIWNRSMTLHTGITPHYFFIYCPNSINKFLYYFSNQDMLNFLPSALLPESLHLVKSFELCCVKDIMHFCKWCAQAYELKLHNDAIKLVSDPISFLFAGAFYGKKELFIKHILDEPSGSKIRKCLMFLVDFSSINNDEIVKFTIETLLSIVIQSISSNTHYAINFIDQFSNLIDMNRDTLLIVKEYLEKYDRIDLSDEGKLFIHLCYSYICNELKSPMKEHIVDEIRSSHRHKDLESDIWNIFSYTENSHYFQIILSTYPKHEIPTVFLSTYAIDSIFDLESLGMSAKEFESDFPDNPSFLIPIFKTMIEFGITKASFGRFMFEKEYENFVLSWLKAGGELAVDQRRIQWDRATYEQIYDWMTRCDVFLNFIKKYLNIYNENPHKIGDILLKIALKGQLPIDENFFCKYNDGILLDSIFIERGYLYLNDQSPLITLNLNDRSSSWIVETRVAFENLYDKSLCVQTFDDVTLTTIYAEPFYLVTAESKEITLKETVFFTKKGHEYLIQDMIKRVKNSYKRSLVCFKSHTSSIERKRPIITEYQQTNKFQRSTQTSSSSSQQSHLDIDESIQQIPLDEYILFFPELEFSSFERRFKYSTIKNMHDYKHPTSRLTTLFLFAIHDFNNAYTLDKYAKGQLMQFSQHWSVKRRPISSNLGFLKHIKKCPDQSISNLWISAHGNPEELVWNALTTDGKFTTQLEKSMVDKLKRALERKLAPCASIFLEACSTGGMRENGEPNIATFFSLIAPGHQVFASKTPISKEGDTASEILIENFHPLRIRIMQQGVDQTFRAFTPRWPQNR